MRKNTSSRDLKIQKYSVDGHFPFQNPPSVRREALLPYTHHASSTLALLHNR